MVFDLSLDAYSTVTSIILLSLLFVHARALQKNKHKEAGSATSQLDKPAFYAKIRSALNAGIAISDVEWDSDAERLELASLHLLTAKPMAYVCNVDEESISKHNRHSEKVFAHVEEMNNSAPTVIAQGGGVKIKRIPRACLRVCSQLESEVQTFDSAESRAEFLAMNSLEGTSLLPIIHTANKLLKNQSYYTVGEAEARAWAIDEGTLAPEAAGKIHSDLQKGFVCAEVLKPADFIKHGGDSAARQAGCMKVEGKNYVVQDGDIIVFRVSGQKGR